MKKLVFPKNFLFGVATSAPQVEGAALEEGKGLSIWDVHGRIPGMVVDGSTPDMACDLYHRYPEDIENMKELSVSSYRFSFSWSRILPEGKGKVNQKGLDYYKRMLELLHKNEIVPNATIYHWDLPYELEREGVWLNRDVINWYGEYASLLLREFGREIPLWVTVNEPIATYVGYGMGNFAPGRKGEQSGRQANHHILLAHGEGVRRFREENLPGAQVGVVVDLWHHHPCRPDHEGDRALAELQNELTYRSYLNPIFKGCYTKELLQYMEEKGCMPTMQEGDMERIAQPLDFFGLNCYNRVVDCCDAQVTEQEKKKFTGGNFMDNGAEFYPKAVYDALHIMKEDYQLAIPIYLTENGCSNCQEEITPDGRIHDVERIRYIQGFLQWIHKALEEGIDVRGYYVWSLLDNWEWSVGYTWRYGLIRTDFQTQERIWKDSAYWYQQILKESRSPGRSGKTEPPRRSRHPWPAPSTKTTWTDISTRPRPAGGEPAAWRWRSAGWTRSAAVRSSSALPTDR